MIYDNLESKIFDFHPSYMPSSIVAPNYTNLMLERFKLFKKFVKILLA